MNTSGPIYTHLKQTTQLEQAAARRQLSHRFDVPNWGDF